MGSGFGISLKKLLNDGYDKTSEDDRDRRAGNNLIIHKSETKTHDKKVTKLAISRLKVRRSVCNLGLYQYMKFPYFSH